MNPQPETNGDTEMVRPTVLIVDDEPMVVESIQDLIELETEYRVLTALSGEDGLQRIQQETIQVIITDFLMPGMNGIDFLLEAKAAAGNITMIILTGYADKNNAIRAINEVGIYHYIEKPWDNDELLIILHNAMERGNLISELKRKYQQVNSAYIETVFRLATISEMFDDDTFSHVLRIAEISRKLAELAGENPHYCHIIKYASMMHDVGKIGVPREILNKKGRLDEKEFAVVRKHPCIGAYILRKPENEIMRMAHDIALRHHEKFGGEGYPEGLKGEEIPKCARIVAIADVFDALMSDRPYKKALPAESVRRIFEEDGGCHFDPELNRILLDNFDTIVQIYNATAYIESGNLNDILFGHWAAANGRP